MSVYANLFFKLFPPPRFLAMPPVGLDISDQSVKFTELEFHHDRGQLTRYGRVKVPSGLIEDGRIVDRDKFKDILVKFRADNRLSNVIVSLPEEQAFIVHLELPEMKRKELRQSIELQLEEHVPLAATEMIFDYKIIKEPDSRDKNYRVSIAVMPRSMIENYLTILEETGYNPIAFEIEGQALARALIPRRQSGVFLITDIGKLRTGFSVVVDDTVAFTSTVAHIGGADITKNISKSLNISSAEAEELKIKKGLLRSADNRELFFALIPVIASLTDEIRRVIDYWGTHTVGREEGNFTKIILSGGQATLPGLTDYLSANLDLPVEVGNPWTNILSLNETIPELDFNNIQRYATALGLSLRNVI
ncbi:MAG: type IV pilus assembly protein PilM [Candidatus Paceibacterota bacterium]